LCYTGTQHLPRKGGGASSPVLRVEVIISKLDRKCGALPVVVNFVALEQQIILVKTEVNRFRNGGDYNRLNFGALLLTCGVETDMQ